MNIDLDTQLPISNTLKVLGTWIGQTVKCRNFLDAQMTDNVSKAVENLSQLNHTQDKYILLDQCVSKKPGYIARNTQYYTVSNALISAEDILQSFFQSEIVQRTELTDTEKETLRLRAIAPTSKGGFGLTFQSNHSVEFISSKVAAFMIRPDQLPERIRLALDVVYDFINAPPLVKQIMMCISAIEADLVSHCKHGFGTEDDIILRESLASLDPTHFSVTSLLRPFVDYCQESHRKLQHMLARFRHNRIANTLAKHCSDDSEESSANFLSSSNAFSSKWLKAIPYDEHLRMANQDFQYAVSRRADLKHKDAEMLGAGAKCNCNHTLDVKAHHLSTCITDGNRNTLHNTLNCTLNVCLREAGLKSFMEPRIDDESHRRADLTVVGMEVTVEKKQKTYTPVSIDLASVDLIAASYVHGAATVACSAAKKIEASKRSKYKKYVECGMTFVPFIFETTGALGPSADSFLGDVYRSQNFLKPNGRKNFSRYWNARLCVCLFRTQAMLHRNKIFCLKRGSPKAIWYDEMDLAFEQGLWDEMW